MESPLSLPRTRAATVVGLLVALGWPFGVWLLRAALHEPFHKTITDNRATAQTGLYAWRRNFWICAAMHAAIDAFGLVVAPALSAHAGR